MWLLTPSVLHFRLPLLCFPLTSWDHYFNGDSHYSKNRHQNCIPFQVSPTKCSGSLQQPYQGKTTSTSKTFHDYNTSLLVKTWPPTNIMFHLLHIIELMLLLLFIDTNSMITPFIFYKLWSFKHSPPSKNNKQDIHTMLHMHTTLTQILNELLSI
jgi:hypothetical protein